MCLLVFLNNVKHEVCKDCKVGTSRAGAKTYNNLRKCAKSDHARWLRDSPFNIFPQFGRGLLHW